MDYSGKFKGFNRIIKEWQSMGATGETAIKLTLSQVDEFEKIIDNDVSWQELLEIFRRGRADDSWLAAEWPDGFDELMICAPMCKYVDWECANCYVGKRQNNFSCSSSDSLFGYIAVLLALENRELIRDHLGKIRYLLTNGNIYWDLDKHQIIIKNPKPV